MNFFMLYMSLNFSSLLLKLEIACKRTNLSLVQHLKGDMKLSYLAQELISTDRLAPQSW